MRWYLLHRWPSELKYPQELTNAANLGFGCFASLNPTRPKSFKFRWVFCCELTLHAIIGKFRPRVRLQVRAKGRAGSSPDPTSMLSSIKVKAVELYHAQNISFMHKSALQRAGNITQIIN